MVYHRSARSDARRDDARGRILDAARVLFTAHGYEATTMQHIVARAGTSIGNAYFYFPNKERLLAQLVELITTRAWEGADLLVQSVAPGPARIGTIMYANLVNMLGVNRDLGRLLFLTDRRTGGIEIVRDISIARWQPHLAASYPELTPAARDLAATAIFGANRAAVERVLSGALNMEPAPLARQMVRWSLRALGSTDAEITSALRIAARRLNSTSAAAGARGARAARGQRSPSAP
jgi:AcrR family transcriptional regulator